MEQVRGEPAPGVIEQHLASLDTHLAVLDPRDRVRACERLHRWPSVRQAEAITSVEGNQDKTVATAIAHDLGCSTAAAVRRARQAADLVALPAVLARVRAGQLGAAHAQQLATNLAGINPDLGAC